jgi:hypothetical protein
MMKMNKLLLYIFLVFITLASTAQNKADTTLTPIPDVIITTNGNLFQCKITEVNDKLVKYNLLNQEPGSQRKDILRNEVYAIAYGNGIAMILTPKLNTSAAGGAALNELAQKKADSILRINRDALIKTNGNLFHCNVVEVNDSVVLYKFPDTDTTGQIHKVPRSEVYTIAYGNGNSQVITPELMGQEAYMNPYKGTCEGWQTFKQNLGKGSLNIGIGFVDFYSPLKDVKSFTDNKTMPTIAAGYTFRIKNKLKAGIQLGLGGNELSKTGVSEYDQIKLSNTIKESFLVVGLYARYNILDGMIRPYVKGGIDFIGVFMTTTSETQSLDGSSPSLKTIVHQSGIKPGLILRGGLEIMFGDTFGIYGDFGTGLSLAQVGVIFNFE